MNLQKAIDIINRNSGRMPVEKIRNRTPKQKRWLVRSRCYQSLGSEEYTDRELIKLSRAWAGHKSKTSFGSNLKYCDHRRNRHRTRQKIQERRFSEIPQNRPVHRENPWNWD